MSKERDEAQPDQGWGVLCCTCSHVMPDEQKYAGDSYCAPSYPCKLVHFGPGHINPDLVRYTDETESCDHYEEAQF